MILPVPDAAFEWRDTAWGPSLVCTPLDLVARHLFTTRPWALGLTRDSGDGAWADVAASLDRPPSALVRLRQVHGHGVVDGSDVHSGSTLPAADIVIGADAGRVLAVQAADCVPLLVADRRTGAVGAAHAGWRGLAQGVPRILVERLQERYGADPAGLVAAVGPSIGACCYEIGPEVRDAFPRAGFGDELCARWFTERAVMSEANPAMAGVVVAGRPGHWFFDAWQCARDQLVAAGVPAEAVFIARLCTASHPHLFGSYRRDGVTAGRIAGAINPSPRP